MLGIRWQTCSKHFRRYIQGSISKSIPNSFVEKQLSNIFLYYDNLHDIFEKKSIFIYPSIVCRRNGLEQNKQHVLKVGALTFKMNPRLLSYVFDFYLQNYNSFNIYLVSKY